MSKRIISIVLVVFMALSLFAFVGCSNREEMQQRISDLQQQITELQSLLQQQTALLAELQSANTEMTNAQTATIAQITELQGQLQSQAEKVTKIEDTINSNLIFNASKALQEVRKYAESKDKSNYLEENWVFVENLIEMAETQIYKQKTIEDIEKLIPKIKASIDLVPKDVVLEEKEPWNGIIEPDFYMMYLFFQPVYITSYFPPQFTFREFTIDDFWMVEDIEDVYMYCPSGNHVHIRITFKVWDEETVTKAVRTIEKLCFHESISTELLGFGA